MRIVALAGGVGGAKLAHGLANALAPSKLTVIVNTADDFEHLGLHISPDLDTMCYTLAGVANKSTGWGRRGETWNVLTSLEELGGPTWFRLGDRDLATHLERTRRLKTGEPLSQITREFCERWGVRQTVLPMTDAAVRTIVRTDEGDLEFQNYFVERRCEPHVTAFEFRGAARAIAAPGVSAAIGAADGVVICPSNPWVSVGPILAIPGIRAAIAAKNTVAISPIIGGAAVRGPAAKMYLELGIDPSALAVARNYQGVAGGFILDSVDVGLAGQIQDLGMRTLVAKTLMRTYADRRRLAGDVLDFLGETTI
jgi:LPPG:FO 2-phospho-L-lactate transferase